MQNISKKQAQEILTAIFKKEDFLICEYVIDTDTFLLYDEEMNAREAIPHYLEYLKQDTLIHPDDRRKVRELYLERRSGEIEIRLQRGEETIRLLMQVLSIDGVDTEKSVPLIVRELGGDEPSVPDADRPEEPGRLALLRDYFFGREEIDQYLKQKDPYTTCGMMLVVLDQFQEFSGAYGRQVGDEMLLELARLLQEFSDRGDVIMRLGADEFALFLKQVSHSALVKKGMRLTGAVRGRKWAGREAGVTCSVGICFLPENESGYTCDQLLGNADWALCRAKENGRDQYVFCDSLRRFEQLPGDSPLPGAVDARYLRNDIISTAFEVFEKTSGFAPAIEQLMEIIGYRFRLDRITVIRTNIQERNTGRQYQWRSENAPEVLQQNAGFTKEDFITLFHSYDEYQTTVLQADDMSAYSPQGAALLMQGGAKTVLYAAMYCEGKYVGAISYVTCREKREWSAYSRKELGEVTKIISAHLARTQAVNDAGGDRLYASEYDSLTGLISFSRFRTELERLVIGGDAVAGVLLYLDFAGFKYFNQKYGYSQGDQLLKEFCNYAIDWLDGAEGVYFTRVVSDQFLLFLPRNSRQLTTGELARFCGGFAAQAVEKFQGSRPRLRIGVYRVEPDCAGASFAIDAANYARTQAPLRPDAAAGSVQLYDETLRQKRRLESAIINEIDDAIREKRFRIFLQPKVSLDGGEVTGAEALVRWETRDGKLLAPSQFIPLCESTGRIRELDFYVFERVAEFLARNKKLGRKQVPISVNASIRHIAEDQTAERYRAILEQYGVDPGDTEIELTETATAENYQEVKQLFGSLRRLGLHTALDDFGAGYSLLNTILDIPADTIKLDRLFVQNCTNSERGIYFLHRMVEMIRGLGYHVICEGVESKEQAQVVKDAGCGEAQGFFFARPLPLEEYEALVYPKTGQAAR